jgi:hypothetical protein
MFTQSMTTRDLTTIPGDRIATNKTKQTTFLSEIELQPGHPIVPTGGLGTNYVTF